MTPAQEAPEAAACKHCGAPPETGYLNALCEPCRDRFAAHPIPGWLKLAVVFITAASGYSMLRFPAVWRAAVVYQHGHADEQKAAYGDAAAEYEKVVKDYPDADEAWVRLAAASHRAGNDRRTVEILNQFRGKKLPSAEVGELNGLIHELQASHAVRNQ